MSGRVVFPHIGDTHLHENAREADRLRVLDGIIAECAGLPVGAWLWPGDLFHIRSTIATRNALKERAKRMADVAPVVTCYGNHDVPGDLDIFGDLRARWPIHVVSVPQVLQVLLPGDTLQAPQVASIFVLPYPTATGLVAAGTPHPDIPNAARAALEAIFADAGAQLAAAREAGHITLTVGHANVEGAVPGIGQPEVGPELALDGALLARLGPGYVGLNHIHAAQDVQGASYAGSICRLSWGETDPKTYTVVEYEWHAYDDGRRVSATWEHRARRMPVDVAPMYHVEGDLTRDGFAWHVTKGPDGPATDAPAAGWSGTEVRVRARYRQREGLVLSETQAAVKAQFTAAARFEWEPVCMPDRGLRAPEVAAARTLPDKLAAWAKVADVTLPGTAAARMGELEGSDAELVVAAVAARMRALTDPQLQGPFADRLDEQQYLFHAEALPEAKLPL